MVSRVIYTSISAQELSQQDVLNILTKAVERNAERSVTGMLIYDQGSFWQALEGSHIDVMDAYDRIATDPRHHDVTLLSIEENVQRMFPKFSMGFPGFLTETTEGASTIAELLAQIIAEDADRRKNAAANRDLLDGFASNGEWSDLLKEGNEERR